MTTKIQLTKLLHQLSDGAFHSGEALGKSFGVSRAAIWKAIQLLRQQGFELNHLRGRGYQLLTPVELLSKEAILSQLQSETAAQCQIEIHDSLNSTNQMLLDKADRKLGDVCLAEQQTAGRGRLGRAWVSPYARNLYCSLYWTFEQGLGECMGLSLLVGVACIDALKRAGFDGIKLKWPNDLYYEEKKLGGILIEMAGDIQGPCHGVIGIGLNVSMSEIHGADIGSPWIDLAGLDQGTLSRNQIAAYLLDALMAALHEFKQVGLTSLIARWPDLDYLKDRPVLVHTHGNSRPSHGIARGITAQGAIVLEQKGELVSHHSGEISIRPEKCV